jgi:hypothetical protein
MRRRAAREMIWHEATQLTWRSPRVEQALADEDQQVMKFDSA